MAKPWMTAKLLRGRKVGFEKANAGFGRGFTYTSDPVSHETPVPYDAPRWKRKAKRGHHPKPRFLPDLTATAWDTHANMKE